MKKVEYKILDWDGLDDDFLIEELDDDCYFVVRFEDGRQVEIIGQDGGELEDQSLCRDWSWVGAELNRAYALGVDHGKAIKTAQIESCEPTEPIVKRPKIHFREEVMTFDELGKPAGYHFRNIEKGQIGDVSKIREECYELLDAAEQGAKVMVLNELADLYGAMEAFLEKEFDGKMNMEDIKKMAEITKRAFESGERK
jgi:phosphoribosyl-ATP pyrophosphohydrolase